jgi:hypothetical protein
MHRTQLLIPEDLHRRAVEVAQRRGASLGAVVREALTEYVARASPGHGTEVHDPVEAVLLAEAFDDPEPEPHLSVDVDHYLYGARRRSRERRGRGRRR